MKFIFAYSIWKHDCGPYSRKLGEFTDVDAIDAASQEEAYKSAVQMLREKYSRNQGYYMSVQAIKHMPAFDLALVDWGDA